MRVKNCLFHYLFLLEGAIVEQWKKYVLKMNFRGFKKKSQKSNILQEIFVVVLRETFHEKSKQFTRLKILVKDVKHP